MFLLNLICFLFKLFRRGGSCLPESEVSPFGQTGSPESIKVLQFKFPLTFGISQGKEKKFKPKTSCRKLLRLLVALRLLVQKYRPPNGYRKPECEFSPCPIQTLISNVPHSALRCLKSSHLYVCHVVLIMSYSLGLEFAVGR